MGQTGTVTSLLTKTSLKCVNSLVVCSRYSAAHTNTNYHSNTSKTYLSLVWAAVAVEGGRDTH